MVRIMKIENRKTIHDNLGKYDILAQEDDFIEVTEWTNSEGIDTTIGNRPVISLSYGELEAINYLSKTLAYGDKEQMIELHYNNIDNSWRKK